MAFNMNGSPLNKLNLFRKGRGADYRQVKREIKSNLRKTGGFEATKEGDGAYSVSGGFGTNLQTGSKRRKLARAAAEQMTGGIDGKAFGDGADSVSYSGTMNKAKSKTVTPSSETNKRHVAKQTGSGYAEGISTKDGKTTTSTVYSNTEHDLTGDTEQSVIDQKNALEANNRPPVSMRSSAFKMKSSPFNNNSWGSPLNWKSPLNAEECPEGKFRATSGDAKGKCVTQKGEDTVSTEDSVLESGVGQSTTTTSRSGENVVEGKKSNVDKYTRACGKKDDGSTGTDPETGDKIKCSRSKDPDYVAPKDTEDSSESGGDSSSVSTFSGKANVESSEEVTTKEDDEIKKNAVSVENEKTEKGGEKKKVKTCNKSASDCNDKQTFNAEKCKCVRDSSKVDKIKGDRKDTKTKEKQERNRIKGKCAPCDC